MSIILKTLQQERLALKKKLEDLETLILDYEEDDKSSSSNGESGGQFKAIVYKKGDTIKDTVLDCVATSIDRFTRSPDIAEFLLQHFPEKKANTPAFKVQVSSLLSSWSREGKVEKYKIGKAVKDTVWGKPEWRDSDGKIKNGKEYKDEEGNIRTEYI